MNSNSFHSSKPQFLPTPNQNKNFGTYPNNNLNSSNPYRIFTPENNGRSSFNNRPYFSDPLTLSRVSQYLDNLGRNSAIDFDRMVDELQKTHREYRRKKRWAFKNHLKKAVEVIGIINTQSHSDGDFIDEDDEGAEDTTGRNLPSYALEGDGDVNSTLEGSYLQQNDKRRKTSDLGAQELISIVTSDEDNSADTTFKDTKDKTTKESLPKAGQNPVPVASVPITKIVKEDTQPTKKRKTELAPFIGNKRFKSSLEPVRPNVSFKDIGGNEKVLKEVMQMLVHMRHPEVYRVLGVSPPRGFLLHGPPGSGKTLMAHAISGELKMPLLKVAAPELVGGLSGQSEERIRELFEQAVALAPCILFIDEVDAITPNRETAHREMERRIVAQLLSSMDELTNNEKGDQVLVIGATNRPDSLDPALRRAGRFDREVCLGIPDRESRTSILHTLCGKLRLSPDVHLSDLAMMTPGYVGADLKSLVTEAAMAAVNRLFKHLQAPQSNMDKETGKETKESVKTVEKTSEEVEMVQVLTDEGEVMEVMDQSGTEDKEIQTDVDSQINQASNESKNEDVDVQVVDNENTDSNDIKVLEVKNIENKSLSVEGPTPTPTSLLHSDPFSVQQLQEVYMTMDDFKEALKAVQPSAKREGFATVPDVKWDDIGSLRDIRNELEMAILAPVKYPQEFAKMGLQTPTGVLLCGPPGCGKTLLAKAVANEAGINFISVKGPELLNMYVGESERAVRQCFQRARSSQPCVIFFDEIDALCPKRNNMENGASRVVNQLLTEMDGMEARTGVFLMAATNRPDIVDPAVMRPGRLDKVLYVGLPAAEDRVDILRAVTKGGKQPVLSEDLDLAEVGRDSRCEGYTGADMAALVREASMAALKEFMSSEGGLANDLKVCKRHFTAALQKIRPSVSDRDKKRYEDLRLQYAAVPTTE